ncbi:DMT family transporter [Myroides sp. 1354]|uniref:DMT family transporter n=1 Tax=unclassified Myroides TaxID=2642485 RepID=UPI0025768407|nr:MULTISPECIES: DMT family transporter [unclassified Myroides]MDM1045419.1 DMT family transporter [Myroides sp. R163-1]MDM1056344.1 DMT family transporter [Myroides sp. 1354]MDM1069550.1 DMT family transporter [Myroides sp. 1372]
MLADNVKSNLLLHLIVFVWGFTAILGNLITLEALPLVWYRIVIAVITLVLLFAFKRQTVKDSKSNIARFLAAGIVIALHWLTFFWAIKVSNVSVTLACLSTGAFFTSILEPIFYKRKIIAYEVFFGFIVVCALGLIFSVSTEYVEGILLALSAACLSAVFSIINGKFAQHSSASIITFYEMIGGLLILSIYLLFSGGFTAEFFTVTTTDWLWLLVLGTFCTAFAFIGSVYVMKYITPFTVMLTINLEPVYGILLAILIFKDSEKMSPEFYVGALLILSTVVLNAIVKNRKKIKVAKI